MVVDIGFVLAGLVMLYFGAGFLVRGASSLAVRMGISALVVGLTVVAYGTSMPELLVSSMATLKGQGGISIGNVLGSNIFNIGAILGLSAMIFPLRVHLQVLKFDTPLMLATALVFIVFFLDQRIGRWEALFLLAGAISYTAFNVVKSRKEEKKAAENIFEEDIPEKLSSLKWDLFYIFLGVAVLAGGSSLLVNGATGLARALGASEALIGLTIVAAGTSLPELATSLVAALKKHSDIAVGNVVGSNIFNILAILGVAGLIRPIETTGISNIDLGVMIGFSLVLIPLMRSGAKISRIEGFFLFAAFLAYMGYLII
ncbi:MAG: calcium/sodium antiporter [Bacteroides sp.]|jgi:cation:H+ antiporter|nr:calcium/sodium antiporter [Bacteroides sp.]